MFDALCVLFLSVLFMYSVLFPTVQRLIWCCFPQLCFFFLTVQSPKNCTIMQQTPKSRLLFLFYWSFSSQTNMRKIWICFVLPIISYFNVIKYGWMQNVKLAAHSWRLQKDACLQHTGELGFQILNSRNCQQLRFASLTCLNRKAHFH